MCDWQLASVPGDLGPPRDQAGAATALDASTVILFGGRDSTGAATNQLLVLDLSDASGAWRPVRLATSKLPPPR